MENNMGDMGDYMDGIDAEIKWTCWEIKKPFTDPTPGRRDHNLRLSVHLFAHLALLLWPRVLVSRSRCSVRCIGHFLVTAAASVMVRIELLGHV